ncbi:MAG: hypothetical protein CMJ53_09650, partial [Planctomycetaceae bacterium]|nr:hypothetical protein [Planctomycetaceae bacterium]
MSDQDLQKQITELLQRIEAMEARFEEADSTQAEAPIKPPPPPVSLPSKLKTVKQEKPKSSIIMTEGVGLEAPKPTKPATTATTATTNDPIKLENRPPAEPVTPRPPNGFERMTNAFSNLTLENLVGGRLYAILGALLVIIAAGTLLKLAWDAELFDLLPDQLKCFLAAAFGGALIVGGEVARRKISAWASIGLTTAGLGVLYATSYAAWDVFEVVPAGVGFILLVATSGLGIFLGARAKLLSVAALSLIGGYLSPLMFMDTDPSTYTLPVYLIALLLVGLILCARYGNTYALLRSISWWGTIGYGTFWIMTSPSASASIHMIFIACVWATIQLELVYSATRHQLTTLARDEKPNELIGWDVIRPLASSITTTAWAIALALMTCHNRELDSGVWLIPVVLATALLAASAYKVGLRTILCTRPTTDLQRLATVFVTEAGALVFVAMSIAFGDWTGVIAWTVLGVGAVVAGDRLNSKALIVYGIITQAIGGTNLMLLEWWVVTVVDADFTGGFTITRGTVLMIVAALGWMITGGLIRRSSETGSGWRQAAHFLVGLGITMSLVGFLNDQSSALHMTWVLVVLSALIMVVGTMLTSKGLQIYGILIQILTFLMIVRVGDWWNAPERIQFELAGIILTSWLWPMLVLSGVTVASGLVIRGLSATGDQWNKFGDSLMGLGLTMGLLGFLNDQSSSLQMTWMMVVLSALVMVVGTMLTSRGLQIYGILLQFLTFLVILIVGHWWDVPEQLQFAGILLTPWWWPMLALSGVTFASSLVTSRIDVEDWRHLAIGLAAFAVGMLFLGVLHEDASHTSVLVVWLLFSAGAFTLQTVRPELCL